jgi:hypothetical protein
MVQETPFYNQISTYRSSVTANARLLYTDQFSILHAVMRQFVGKLREIRHPTAWLVVGKQHPVAEECCISDL